MPLSADEAVRIAGLINWRRAWSLCLNDDNDRVFYTHPIERRLIEVDSERWLNDIRRRLSQNEFIPRGMTVCDSPKAKGLIRPGGILSKEDQIIYTALIDVNLQPLRNALAWSQRVIDFSYQPAENIEARHWFSNTYSAWTSFREESLRRLKDDYEFVVFTDISGYYDHISLSLLASDLRDIGCDQASVDLLSECLNRWAQVPGTGIPQGYSPSDYLGKVYLNSIDHRLNQSAFVHTRYVDDVRIFCRTHSEAKRAIVTLSALLRERGLSLQSAKTLILDRQAASIKLEGVMPILGPVTERLIEDIRAILGIDYEHVTTAIIDAVLRDKRDEIPGEILEEVFAQHIANNNDFDSTLFHYLVRRLGSQRNHFALTECSRMLITHPQETKEVLNYFRNLGYINEAVDGLLADCLVSPESVYSYQKYQILEWILNNFQRCSNQLLGIARQICLDQNLPSYLRAYAREILGRFGSPADLESLRTTYDLAQNGLQECEIIYALRRMEVRRRNEFYGRIRNTSDYHNRAVLLAGAR